MTDNYSGQPAGWYYAEGDPPGTQRYWDGAQWQGSPQVVSVGQAPGAATGQATSLASLGQRIGARLIDGIISGIFSFVISLILIGGAAFTADGVAGLSSFQRIAPVLVGIGFSVVYEGLLVAKTGATPGKMALGLKVRNADGSAVSFATAVKRYGIWGLVSVVGALVPAGIAAAYSGVSLLLIAGGMIMIATDDRNQAPWDKIADTIIVDD